MKKKYSMSKRFMFLSILAITVIFISVGISIYFTMSRYMSKESMKYLEITTGYFLDDLDTTLDNIASNIEQTWSNEDLQEILYHSIRNPLDSKGYTTVQSEIRNLLAKSDNIYSVEVFSLTEAIYPLSKEAVSKRVPEDIKDKSDEKNGKLVWYKDDNGYITGVKKILLSNYGFVNAGYMVVRIQNAKLDLLLRHFKDYDELKIGVFDEEGNMIKSNLSEEEHWDTHSYNNALFSVYKKSTRNLWTVQIYGSKSIGAEGTKHLIITLVVAFVIGASLFILISKLIASSVTIPIRELKIFFHNSDGRLKRYNKSYNDPDLNDLIENYNKLIDENQLLVNENIEKITLISQSEMVALQSQVNPHFIVNALESVYFSILPSVDEESATALLALAKLFQYILKAPNFVTIEDEIDYIKQYMTVEQYRFGDKIICEIIVDENTKSIKIPKLLIQPLVENIIKHSVEKSIDNITIKIEVFIKDYCLNVIVSDNGLGIDSSELEALRQSLNAVKLDNYELKGTSIGLSSIARRLYLLYGSRGNVLLSALTQSGGFVVSLSIPLS